jgi:hypothetical protein
MTSMQCSIWCPFGHNSQRGRSGSLHITCGCCVTAGKGWPAAVYDNQQGTENSWMFASEDPRPAPGQEAIHTGDEVRASNMHMNDGGFAITDERHGLERHLILFHLVTNPDPEARSSWTIQCYIAYPSARSDFWIRICHWFLCPINVNTNGLHFIVIYLNFSVYENKGPWNFEIMEV